MLRQVLNQKCPLMLAQPQTRSLRVAFQKRVNHCFERERREFKERVKQLRKQHKEDYWKTQTMVENDFLRQHKDDRIQKHSYDMVKWRTQICNISYQTEKKLNHLAERENRLLKTLRAKDVQAGKQKMLDRYMLDTMQIESKRWPKLNDLDHSIHSNVLIPQTVLNYHDYQAKLQRLAFYAEQGDNEAMQKLLDKEDVMAKKNSYLQPLYRDIKTTIKHMTYTKEYQLMREYVRNRQLIFQALPQESQKAQEGARKLKEQYAKLISNYRRQMQEDPEARLGVMQKRIEDMF